MADAKSLLILLQKKKLRLGSVESLTGGLFASTICSVPGASKVFYGSIVAYDNSVKTALAGVKKSTLDKYGAVSEQVAREMAEGGRQTLKVDLAVAFTGNAGPTAEAGCAPVGQVYMAIATEQGSQTFASFLSGSRNEIRERCVAIMVDKLVSLYEENGTK
jgi:PncC family amidohydrolase